MRLSEDQHLLVELRCLKRVETLRDQAHQAAVKAAVLFSD